MNENLSLSEKLYLLSIHPEKGGVIASASSTINYVLIGALLLELFLNRNVRFENKRIIVVNEQSDHILHKLLLSKLASRPKPMKIAGWIQRLSFSIKHVKKEIQLTLKNKRIILMRPQKFLFFRWEKPVLLNRQVVYRLVDQTGACLFRGTDLEEDIMLLSLIKPAGLLKRIFPDKNKRSMARTKLSRMTTENPVSIAVAEAIAAAQAVAASVAVTAAASRSVSS